MHSSCTDAVTFGSAVDAARAFRDVLPAAAERTLEALALQTTIRQLCGESETSATAERPSSPARELIPSARAASGMPQDMPMTRAARIVLCLVCVNACAEDAPPPRVSGADVHLAPDTTAIRGLVADNSTMDSMLRDTRPERRVVQEVITAARAVFDPRSSNAASRFCSSDAGWGAAPVRVQIDADSFLRIATHPDSPTACARKCCRYPRRWSR